MTKPGPEKQFGQWLKLRVSQSTLDKLDRDKGAESRSAHIRRLIEAFKPRKVKENAANSKARR